MAPRLALKHNPEAAFEALYRRHVHDVYRYALAILGNRADAEDVAQITFLNAYRAFHAGERPRKPHNWLRAIAHNVCRQRFRQAARRPRELAELGDIPVEDPAGDSEAPSAEDIARALRGLPFNQRAALVMRELEDRRQSEIAEALGLSESAVEALLFRARRAMREQLESSMACGEAARAISRQLDRSLPRADRAALRAHLRECPDCAAFARQMRAQRGVLRKLGAVPLPASLLSWSGGSSVVEATGVAATTGGAGLALKVAGGIVATAALAGAGGVGVHKLATASADRAEGAVLRPPPADPPLRSAAIVHPDATAHSGTAKTPARHSASAPRHSRRSGSDTARPHAREGGNRPASDASPRNAPAHGRGHTGAATSRAHPARPASRPPWAHPARPHAQSAPHPVHVRTSHVRVTPPRHPVKPPRTHVRTPRPHVKTPRPPD
jgi:RNA polymerase sigma-70 factor (ECF subfamily)